jgi:hypothetical protein
MATVDIEAPGASEAALEAAIRALIPISTTTISSPVNYVDITLPAGYSAFRLVLSSLAIETGAAFWGAFSQDGGSTWLTDYDTDWIGYNFTRISVNVLGTVQGSSDPSAGLEFGVGDDQCSADFTIVPGSATLPATMMGLVHGTDAAARALQIARIACTLNTARVNAIRITPFDGGSTSPATPSVSLFIDYGTLSLYGVL